MSKRSADSNSGSELDLFDEEPLLNNPVSLKLEGMSLMDSWIVELPIDLGPDPYQLVLLKEAPPSAPHLPKRRRIVEDIKHATWEAHNDLAKFPIPGRFVARMFIRDNYQMNEHITRGLFCAMANSNLVQIHLTRKFSDPDAGLHLFTLEIFLINQFVLDLLFQCKTKFDATLRSEKLTAVGALVRDLPELKPMSNFSEAPLADPIPGFKLELWDWQKRNVTFLRRIEGIRQNQIIVLSAEQTSKPRPVQIGDSQVTLCPWNGEIKLNANTIPDEMGMRLECRGGIFCDPTSTGKSMTIIASIWKQKLHRDSYVDYFEQDLPLAEQSKYFFSKATLIVCPARLVKQWEAYFKLCLGDLCTIIDKKMPSKSDSERLLVKGISTTKDFSKLDLFSITEVVDVFIIPLNLLNSQAYCKRFDAPHDLRAKDAYLSKLGVLNSQLRKTLNKDEVRRQIKKLEADRTYQMNWDTSGLIRVANTVANVRAACLRKVDPVLPTEIKGIPLEGFFWSRKVVDEAHELVSNSKPAEAVASLRANYSWLLTATPDFQVNSANAKQAALPRLLNVKQECLVRGSYQLQPLTIMAKPWAMDAFLTAWCRRSGVIAKKPMTETRVEVSLKPKELALYHSHQSNSLAHLLQFCSYHNELQGTNEEETTYTVSETAELLQKERRQRQEQIQSEIATIDANIEQLWQMLKLEISEGMPRLLPQMLEFENARVKFVNLALAEIPSSDSRFRSLLNKLNAAFSGLKGCNTSLASVLRQQAYYDSILQLLSNSQPIDCAIHMGPIPMETTALLICGHYFCQACLTACWANLVNLTCPCCRYPIKPNRDMRIVDRRPEEEVQKEKEANLIQEADLSNRYGSKIKSLLSIIGRIQADPDQGKILVFAQWDNLLKQIGDALKSLGIPNACPRGNIGQINSAFNQFYTDRNMRVLLLSTKHNLSGSHLVEANNLIFVHPFPDAPDAALREWEQAVSRMQRFGQKRDLHVYYMVTKNTIEVELFKTFVEFKDKQQAILAKIESIVTEDAVAEPTEVL